MTWLTVGTWVVTAGLLIPAAIFCAQCLGSLLPRRRRNLSTDSRPRVAVLMPAHNEEGEIGATLAALRPQLGDRDVALVVADNCTDRTADLARAAGAEVLERKDDHRRGKGFALAGGLAALKERQFDVLVVLDADCRVEPGAIDALAQQVDQTARPAQAIYLMESCPASTPRDRVSTWAFMVKNLVRPLGLARFGLPCPLTGTGMAFPRQAIERADLASGNIVEDMQLGLDLALGGCAPLLCPEARVIGRLPHDGKVALTQRRRWEHGHLNTIFRQAPRLICLGLARRKPAAVAMALDLMVPPLSLFVTLLILSAVGAGALAATTATSGEGRAAALVPALLLAGALLAVLGSVFLAWIKYGRQTLGPIGLLAAVAYVTWKLPMYVLFLFRPEKKWIRTARLRDRAKAATAA